MFMLTYAEWVCGTMKVGNLSFTQIGKKHPIGNGNVIYLKNIKKYFKLILC